MSEEGIDKSLSDKEVEEGWHFCWDFDGLLRNNNEEKYQCKCFEDAQKQTNG